MRFIVHLLASVVLLSGIHQLYGQAPPGTLLWQYDLGSSIYFAPALAPSGVVYVSTGSGVMSITNWNNVASNLWTFASSPRGAPMIGPDGTVFVVGGTGYLYAINPGDGSVKWSFSGSGGGGSPSVAVDGTILFDGYGYLFATSPGGVLKWKSTVGDSGNFSSPVMDAQGLIYINSWEFLTLHVFNPDGTSAWTAQFPNRPSESCAIGGNNTIYVAGGALYAFNSAGTNLWSVGSGMYGPPVVGPDGTVYVADNQRTLWAINSTGAQIWSAFRTKPLYGSVTASAIDAGGTVYYCVSNTLWAVSSTGDVRWAFTSTAAPQPSTDLANASPIIGPDGTIYACIGTTLYAIASGTNGPAKSPWPMYKQNVRHTGKVEAPVLQSPKKRADSNFQFQLYPQQFGLTYTIQSSTNLNTWLSITSFVANSLPIDVVDLGASNFSASYYRALSSP